MQLHLCTMNRSLSPLLSADVMNERMRNESRLSPITQYHLSKSFVITLSIYKMEVLFPNAV